MVMRYGTALSCGALVTLALFWVMTTLISLQHGEPLPPTVCGTLAFLPKPPQEPVVPRHERRFQELTEPVDVPPARQRGERYEGTGVRSLPARAEVPEFGLPTLAAQQDGPLVAMVRVQPVYPRRALEMDLEGWVLVEFDVTSEGTVTNARVVESSHPLFEKAAVDTALKFRFKAQVVDGVARPTTGLRNLFRFEMERT